ncbi:hypothetical protein [Cryobacterium zhongshanensis]|uniref:FXSXX-COOH protein n=1 Tax=Cryobacterium zhongshanensis TaxID=2928153 RepID=A0AA41QZB7_9MICO|nr:hypothetical protein [Cryobacterium zhongshanensis]MCI4659643.1 hypothetical protein [Cryobacterium zhongshanensis]
MHSARHTSADDDTGIEILPGLVCVDLTVADVSALTVGALGDALAEADAQEHASSLEATELLGDLDLNPL